MANQEIFFLETHEWVQFIDETTVRVGISDYAQNELGDIVFVNLPEEGDEVMEGDIIADVESVKAVSDIYSPVTGVIKAVNEELLDQPEFINTNAFEAWLVEIEDITDKQDLLTEEEYNKLLDE